MPILEQEVDTFPHDLLDRSPDDVDGSRQWWAFYTRSRQEKQFMRRLQRLDVSFYCPIVEQRRRSPAGRMRTSYVPLFQNYVFVLGDTDDRYRALTTNCVSRVLDVTEPTCLLDDLRSIRSLIHTGAPVTPEAKLQQGMKVRVRSGIFAGHEGVVAERRGQRRLIVSVNFLQQGASVVLEDCEVERI